MSRLTEKDITWFLENLDLQIEDMERQQKDGANIEIYFDTADIYDAVLGVQAFFQDEEEFKQSLFNNDKTLVHCLATSGWLGTVMMLPSHQAEFLSLININFGLGSEESYPQRKTKFLEFVKESIGSDRSKQIPIDKIGEDIAEDELIDFVRQIKQQAESAKVLFKAFECIGRWQPRLARLMREKSLHLESHKYNFSEIISSNNFHYLKAAFDERRRSANTMNNFADALAVAVLIERVKLYEEKKTDRLPRFYVSTALFKEVIEMAGVAQQLNYRKSTDTNSAKNPGILNNPCGVLRGTDYLIFKAAFGSPPKEEQPQAQTKTFAGMDLYGLREAISKILVARQPLTPEAVKSIEIEGRSLNDLIQEVRDFSFLNNIWLQFIRTEDIKKVRDLEAEARDLVKKEQVNKAIKATKAALEVNLSEYEKVKSFWQELRHASHTLQARTSKDASEQLDVFRDLGLLRFSFPARVHDRIEEVLQTILRGGENEVRAARNWVVTAYCSASSNLDEETDNLALVSAVLWSVGMDKKLIKRLEESMKSGRPLRHFSLMIIYAAAIFRSCSNLKKSSHTSGLIERGRRVVEKIAEEFESTDSGQKKVDLAIGLAYLHFHLWWSLGYRPFWYPSSEFTKTDQAEEGKQIIDKAIDYSKQAYDFLPDDDMRRKVYALNQYLFYSVMGNRESSNDEMDKAAATLGSYKSNRDWWQYRFEDTLARYFHRMAIFAGTDDEWKRWMDLAYRHVDKASKESHGDMDVENYVTIFGIDYKKRRNISPHT